MRFLSCNFRRRNSLILYGILLSRPELSPISIKREGQFKLGWRRHEYGSEWYDYAGLERVRDFFTPIKRGWLQNKGDEALLSCALRLRLRIDQIVGRSIEGSEPVVHRLERGTKYLGTGC